MKVNEAFKPEKLYNYTPAYAGVDPLEPDEFADSGNMVCVRTSEAMIPYLITAWEIYRYAFVIKGDEAQKEHTLQQLQELLSQIMTAQPCSFYGGGGTGGGSCLPDCVEIVDNDGDGICETINIYEEVCEVPVQVNIYDGCGCGGVGMPGSGGYPPSGGELPPGGNPEEPDIPINKRTTPCDAATTVVPYILQQTEEFFLAARQRVDSGSLPVEALLDAAEQFGFEIGDTFAEVLDELSELGFQAIENLCNDVDFELRYQEAFMSVFGSDQFITKIDRPRLRQVTGGLPLFWGTVVQGTILLPRLIFSFMHRVLNLKKINLQVQFAKGTGNAALCDYLYGEIGIAPPDIDAPPETNPPDKQFDNYFLKTLFSNSQFGGSESTNNVILPAGAKPQLIIYRGSAVENGTASMTVRLINDSEAFAASPDNVHDLSVIGVEESEWLISYESGAGIRDAIENAYPQLAQVWSGYGDFRRGTLFYEEDNAQTISTDNRTFQRLKWTVTPNTDIVTCSCWIVYTIVS